MCEKYRTLSVRYPYVITAVHLDAYLDEFAFRFNRRKSRRRGMLFYRLLENAVVTKPKRFRPSRASLMPSKHNL